MDESHFGFNNTTANNNNNNNKNKNITFLNLKRIYNTCGSVQFMESY